MDLEVQELLEMDLCYQLVIQMEEVKEIRTVLARKVADSLAKVT